MIRILSRIIFIYQFPNICPIFLWFTGNIGHFVIIIITFKMIQFVIQKSFELPSPVGKILDLATPSYLSDLPATNVVTNLATPGCTTDLANQSFISELVTTSCVSELATPDSISELTNVDFVRAPDEQLVSSSEGEDETPGDGMMPRFCSRTTPLRKSIPLSLMVEESKSGNEESGSTKEESRSGDESSDSLYRPQSAHDDSSDTNGSE